MDDAISLTFQGPFSWAGNQDAPSVFEHDIRGQPGIYLWTVPLSDGHLVYYVGETGRSFERRLSEHYSMHASGMYHLYSAVDFRRGVKNRVWEGCLGRKDRGAVRLFMRQYSELASHVAEMAETYRFLLAPFSGETRMRQRAEAAIARLLYTTEGLIGDFQDQGIRYAPRWETERPVPCRIDSSVRILGLPEMIDV